MKKVRVLIIDDSALVRKILTRGLSSDSRFEVVGTAPDVFVARDKIVTEQPDVLTLDIEMPRMDGIDFLKRLMPQYPLPVVIVSALAEPGARATLDALEYGAIDFVLKPSASIRHKLTQMIDELKVKLVMASKVDVSKWRVQKYAAVDTSASGALPRTTDKIIAIGASTGGTVALRHIISGFPADMPGTVIVQHMPPTFTKLFADKLNEVAAVEVKEAETGDRVYTGRVLVAPGGQHLKVERSGGQYRVRCLDGDKVNGHCPSVDVLFDSVARCVGPNAIGLMLTGMGRDGADAMLGLRQTGARTFAQDAESSVVFGMPKAAYECGAVEKLIHLNNITSTLIKTVAEVS
jgi:two-component system, chemotaxis family, protein-glutamate methylesterase/glutaminase